MKTPNLEDEPVAAIHGNHLCGIYGWGLRLLVSPEEMIELEVAFERLIVPQFPVVAFCAYDARKFTGVELLDALKDHDDTFRFPLGRTIA